MFHSKKIQAEKSYGNMSDMEKFAKETAIKNFNGNDLIAKRMHLQVLKNLSSRYNFHNKVPQ